MPKYIISVWDSIATLFIMNESDDKLTYSLVDIPEENAQVVQDYLSTLVDLTTSEIYDVTSEAIAKLRELGLVL